MNLDESLANASCTQAPVLVATGIGTSRGGNSLAAGSRAALAAIARLGGVRPSVIFVHASPEFDFAQVMRGARIASGEALVLGATTAGEIHAGLQQSCVVVTALGSPYLRGAAALGRHADRKWSEALDEALAAPAIQPFLDSGPRADRLRVRNGTRRFAVLLLPGATQTECSSAYEIIDAFRRRTLGRIPIFAGAAADGWKMESNAVALGELVSPGAMVLALFETELDFGISIAHGFRPTAQRHRVDAAEGRELLLVEGCAASHVLGANPASRGLSSLEHITFATGRTFGMPNRLGEYSINVASYPTPTGAVRMSQPVLPGSELVEMEIGRDATTGGADEAVRKAMMRIGSGRAALLLVHYSAMRERILGGEGARAEIARIEELAGQTPVVGFCSQGEGGQREDGSSHFNSASVAVLAIGADLSEQAQVARENARLLEQTESLRELREVSDALRMSEARMRETFENAPIGMLVCSPDGARILDVNRALCRFLGLAREEVLRRNLADISHPEDLPATFDGLRRVRLDGASSFSVETRYIRADGSRIWGLSTGSALFDERGEPRQLIIQIQDIQRRKQAEDVLQETKDRLAMAMDASNLSLWDFDLGDGCVAFDERWAATVGGPAGVRFEQVEDLRQMVHPEDLRRVLRSMIATFRGRTASFLEEFRFRALGGDWIWVRSSGKVVERDERGRAVRAIGTNLDITDHKCAEDRIRRMAFTDALTGLPNRLLFEDRFEQQLAIARRERRRFAVLFLDLDNFKPVNDRFGHDVGDWLLRALSDRIRWIIRESDTLARIGGDEFLLLLPGVSEPDDALRVAEKILSVARTPFQTPGREVLRVSCSIGVAVYPDHATNLRDMMRCGDQAMYLAKKGGRDGAQMYGAQSNADEVAPAAVPQD